MRMRPLLCNPIDPHVPANLSIDEPINHRSVAPSRLHHGTCPTLTQPRTPRYLPGPPTTCIFNMSSKCKHHQASLRPPTLPSRPWLVHTYSSFTCVSLLETTASPYPTNKHPAGHLTTYLPSKVIIHLDLSSASNLPRCRTLCETRPRPDPNCGEYHRTDGAARGFCLILRHSIGPLRTYDA